MRRLTLLLAALLLCSAVFVFSVQAQAAPLTLESYANVDQLGPGESVNYTLAIHRTAAEIGDVSVRVEAGKGLAIWAYGPSSDCAVGTGGFVLACVVPVSASAPALISFSARASPQPRCGAPFESHVSAATKFTTETAELEITTATDRCLWLPLMAPEPTASPYPPPAP